MAQENTEKRTFTVTFQDGQVAVVNANYLDCRDGTAVLSVTSTERVAAFPLDRIISIVRNDCAGK